MQICKYFSSFLTEWLHHLSKIVPAFLHQWDKSQCVTESHHQCLEYNRYLSCVRLQAIST